MARVPEQTLEKVVTEVSQKMVDADYIGRRVDELIAVQPNLMQYVVAHKSELGVELIVQVLFHAAIMAQGLELATGASPLPVSFVDLDAAANATPTLERFSEAEPALANFVYNNLVVETPGPAGQLAGKLLAHIGRAMLDKS
ncbi:MAG: hypothetical protein KC503_02680 [Myxococcales bacterium]|nr:hypothetical protein [Myxococcales bacterium]